MSLISGPIRDELVRAYTAPDRHYHNLAHIETMLGFARAHGGALSDPEAVEAAIWFHDAVYDTRRQDNETRSAELATQRLGGATTSDRISFIATMIRATASHRLPDFSTAEAVRDCALFLDMDLAILGSVADDFA